MKDANTAITLLEKWPKKGFERIRTHDLCFTGAMLYHTAYRPTLLTLRLEVKNKVPYWHYNLQVMQMISDLRESFVANLDNLDWMDTSTKKYAKEKVIPS